MKLKQKDYDNIDADQIASGTIQFDVGLKFMSANTDYLKQFVEIINNHYIK
jgi:hypothetical protein